MGFFLSYSFYSFFLEFIFTSSLQYDYKIVAYLIKTYSNIFLLYSFVLFLKNTNLYYYLFTFFFFKFYFFTDCLTIFTIPAQLLVGYNNIHPFLFYFSFVFGILTLTQMRNVYIFNIFNIFFLASVALLLGGLWGLGNSIWGFFWVNDQIEIVLLLYVLILLYLLHVYIQWENIVRSITILICFILVLFFLRWGFTFTRHNFFNVKLLVNIVASFQIFFCNFLMFFSVIVGVNHFEKVLIVYICCLLFFSNILSLNYRLFLIFFHMFILILFVTWLKYRNNNYILGNLNFFFIANGSKYSSFAVISFFSIFKPLFYKLSFLVIKIKLYIASKSILTLYTIYVSYFLIYYWYIMLVSMSKIYIR